MATERSIPEPSFDARAVVKSNFRQGTYEPEVMVYGQNYSVGPVQTSSDAARKLAEEVIVKLNAKLLLALESEIISKYKIAKP